MKLLNIDANPKTIKGQAKGYMTAVLYLAPYKASGHNVCPFAEIAGCWKTCLNTAGRGGMAKGNSTFDSNGISLPDNAIQRARISRTRLWIEDRTTFLSQLQKEIAAFIKKAGKRGLTPVVRLNGTSDIQWENVRTQSGKTLMELFPDVQFYDYTKIPKRVCSQTLPKNYYLCYSYSEATPQASRFGRNVESLGHSVVYVTKDEATKSWVMGSFTADGLPVVDGDEHDLRFLDPPGARVVLRAKGSAKRETNGFVLQ